MRLFAVFILLLSALLTACKDETTEHNASSTTPISSTESAEENTPRYSKESPAPAKAWLDAEQTYNKEAPIPPQCYTKTEQTHNPCYVCHQSYKDGRPNVLNDGFQQGSYAFSDVGVSNSWRNLFKDRTEYIASISDEDILKYIDTDNYSPFIHALKNNEDWQGVIPEIKNLHLGAAAFDEKGLALDGSGWVAFNYKPLPSTFWPTNGSTDDVMIRLPSAFMQSNNKYYDDIYFANLALVELVISGEETTTTLAFDEKFHNTDINKDGILKTAETLMTRQEHYLGDAKTIALENMLYPEGTSFLHTVRYVGFDENDDITVSKRMKEVRYMHKKRYKTPGELKGRYYMERKEKHFEKLPFVSDFGDEGLSNKHGWVLLGFIEDEQGDLRKQNFEEQFFCTGCHKSMGATIDDTISFPRKQKGFEGWGYINLKALVDAPNKGEQQGEYLTYLQRVGGGDEFRQNQEMLSRWFNADGTVKSDEIAALKSIYPLITPTKKRALQLNKAYKAIVEEQSYIYGRDAVITPATNVFSEVDPEKAPLLPEHRYQWDIRHNWH